MRRIRFLAILRIFTSLGEVAFFAVFIVFSTVKDFYWLISFFATGSNLEASNSLFFSILNSNVSKRSENTLSCLILCTYQWFAQDGGAGNQRELDFVKRKWVGILTSTTVPRVGNDRHLEKWRGPENEWVVRHLGKNPEVI